MDEFAAEFAARGGVRLRSILSWQNANEADGGPCEGAVAVPSGHVLDAGTCTEN